MMEEQVRVEPVEEMLVDFQDTIHLGEEVQIPIHETACTLLYDEKSYSILHTCLELLNLQELYRWSSASVKSLLK